MAMIRSSILVKCTIAFFFWLWLCALWNNRNLGIEQQPSPSKPQIVENEKFSYRPRDFRAVGKVQSVNFRQTIVQSMIKRGLEGGATNRKDNKNTVDFTVVGRPDTVDLLVKRIGNGKELNSKGARADEVIEMDGNTSSDAGIMRWRSHQVTTDNVNTFNWNPEVKMYI